MVFYMAMYLPTRLLAPVVPPAGPRRAAARGRFAALAVLAVLACLGPKPAAAVTVAGLYEGTVAATDRSERGLAAAYVEALRQVAVRATGRRAAASDPALAGLFADARRYVQTWRPAGTGQVAVGFDARAVEAALAAAGQPLWPADRPAVLAVVLLERAGAGGAVTRTVVSSATTGEERRGLERVAQLRGLPLQWPAPEAAAALTADAAAGRVDQLLGAARAQRADAVLWVRVPAVAGTPVLWAYVSDGATQQGRGDAAEGLHALADAWAGRDASAPGAALAQVVVVVSGVDDLAAYAGVLAALEASPTVREVAVAEVAGSTLRLRLRLRGDAGGLARTLAAGGRLLPDAGAGVGDGTVRLRYQP